jgi:hypothetical protein
MRTLGLAVPAPETAHANANADLLDLPAKMRRRLEQIDENIARAA